MHLLDLSLKLNSFCAQTLSLGHGGLGGFLLLLRFMGLVLDGVHQVLHFFRLLIKLRLRTGFRKARWRVRLLQAQKLKLLVEDVLLQYFHTSRSFLQKFVLCARR